MPLGAEGVTVLLPCKPDRASRPVSLAGERVVLEMAGCEAGGATFAVGRIPVADAAQAQARMAAWRQDALQRWQGARLSEQPAALPRAAVHPAPLALRAESSARLAPARMLWFAQVSGGQSWLYQAIVLGRPSDAEAPTTFFEGIRLP